MRHRNNNNNSNSSSHSVNSNSSSSNNTKKYNNKNTNGANMYRSGYNPSSLEAGRDTNANILEQQNNDRISELSDQVARLKGLTIDIGNEVREQNSLLDDMGDGFSGVSNLLGSSLKRIGTMLESGGAKHMCYLVAFVVLVMVFLYWVRYNNVLDATAIYDYGFNSLAHDSPYPSFIIHHIFAMQVMSFKGQSGAR